MTVDTMEIAVSLFIDVRISLVSGNVVARHPGASSDAQDRLLLAGLGPLRSVSPCGNTGLLLETARGSSGWWASRRRPGSSPRSNTSTRSRTRPRQADTPGTGRCLNPGQGQQ